MQKVYAPINVIPYIYNIVTNIYNIVNVKIPSVT
jgi:hypothetical protein